MKFANLRNLAGEFWHLVTSRNQTYFPDARSKSRIQILFENIAWVLKNREVNRYYYIYGLDRKDTDTAKHVISYRAFTKIRDSRNLHLNGKNFNYAAILRDKFVFGQFLSSIHIPTPQNKALVDAFSITWLDTMVVDPITKICRDGKIIDGFCKKLSGLQGKGAFRLSVAGPEIYIADVPSSIEELAHKLNGVYLFQERVNQHAQMNQLFPHALNTMRIVTFNVHGKIHVFNAAMRIGTGHRNVDNWGIGGIAVGIDLETGNLRRNGYFKPKYGRLIEVHPDTGVKFEGFQIPFFKECLKMVSQVHQYLYGIHSIGWDVAVGPDGPILIEGNEDWDGSFAMAAEDNFKSRFMQMFQPV